MSNVKSIFPANDFDHVMDEAKGNYESALIIGYDTAGRLDVRAGGLTGFGNQPTAKDWLFMIEVFKSKLINGDYNE